MGNLAIADFIVACHEKVCGSIIFLVATTNMIRMGFGSAFEEDLCITIK